VGCVPSKRLLWAAQIMHMAKNHQVPGIDLRVKSFDFQAVIGDELNLVARMRREKYEKVLHGLEKVSFFEGYAKFISANGVRINGEVLEAGRMIIATGSKATAPPVQGLKAIGCLTHVEALKLQQLPEKLIIIGAGPVSMELAQMFARFGSKVTIVKRSPGILRFAEPELTQCLVQILSAEGIEVVAADGINHARRENGKKVLAVTVGGKKLEVAADEILAATGKIPNTMNLGLETAGVKTDEKQAVIVNDYLQTSRPYIFAVGDVARLPARFEPSAGREGTLAAENALTGSTHSIDYDSVPFTIFTDPQLASVGLTEAEQMKRLGVCDCRTVSFDKVPKAIIMNRTEGLIKMVAHPSTRQIMGVHILAPEAGELIAQAMVLIKNENTIDEVIASLPMFPTLSEALKIVSLSFDRDISNLSCCI
jgi:mercuric reductase